MTVSAPMSLRGFARHIGVSDKAIRKALTAGVFSDGSIHRDATGTPSVVNVTLAVTEWKRSGRLVRSDAPPAPSPAAATSPDASATPPDDPKAQIDALLAQVRALRRQRGSEPPDDAADDPPGGGPDEGGDHSMTLVEAQKETHIQRARMLRMENDLREGTLVEADQASRAAFEFARTLREAILNVPARISAELAAESDASRVHLRLDAALREALVSVVAILDGSGLPPATPMEGTA